MIVYLTIVCLIPFKKYLLFSENFGILLMFGSTKNFCQIMKRKHR